MMCHGHAYQYMGVFLQFCVEGRAIGFLQHISIDCLFYNKIHMWFISLHLRNFALAMLSGYVLPTQTSSTMVKRVNYWRIRVISCFLCLLKFVKCVLVLSKNFPLFITRISYLHSLFEYKIVLYCRIFLLNWQNCWTNCNAHGFWYDFMLLCLWSQNFLSYQFLFKLLLNNYYYLVQIMCANKWFFKWNLISFRKLFWFSNLNLLKKSTNKQSKITFA